MAPRQVARMAVTRLATDAADPGHFPFSPPGSLFDLVCIGYGVNTRGTRRSTKLLSVRVVDIAAPTHWACPTSHLFSAPDRNHPAVVAPEHNPLMQLAHRFRTKSLWTQGEKTQGLGISVPSRLADPGKRRKLRYTNIGPHLPSQPPRSSQFVHVSGFKNIRQRATSGAGVCRPGPTLRLFLDGRFSPAPRRTAPTISSSSNNCSTPGHPRFPPNHTLVHPFLRREQTPPRPPARYVDAAMGSLTSPPSPSWNSKPIKKRNQSHTSTGTTAPLQASVNHLPHVLLTFAHREKR